MVAIKHKKVTGRPVAVSDWDDNHVITGTPGMTIVFDETGTAVEAAPGEGGTVDLSGYYTKAEVDAAIAAAIGGTPPVVTLAALSLSSSSFTVGVITSGTILGATAGSTITLSGAPTGFTINSAARTWAYDGTGAEASGNLTLTETLAGATNTPRVSNLSYIVEAAPVAGVDPLLTAPVLTASTDSPTNGSAPKFFIDSDDTLDIALGYKVVVQWRDKNGNVLGTGESTQLTVAPDGSDLTISGLAALPAGTRRYRARFERVNGLSYSNWSDDLAIGPDDVAPVLSSPTQTDVGATGATLGFTTTEAGTRYSVVVPAAESTPSNTQVKAGQRANGTAATLVYTGAATAGVNTYTASGFTTGTAYKVATVVEDASINPNLSEVLTDTFTTAAPSAAKLWQGAAGTNRHAETTVDGTGFIATNTAAQGGPAMVRSLATLPTKVKFEITILSLNAGSFYFGISDLAQSLAGYLRPGEAGVTGWCFRAANGNRELFFQGSAGNAYASGSAAVGDVWSMECDFTNPAAPVLHIDCKPSGGSTSSVLNNVGVNSNLPTTPTLTIGLDNNASIKINNGQEPWVIPARSGFVGASA